MKIIKSKSKSKGYTVVGVDKRGVECIFLINKDGVNNYKKAINYWNKNWGQSHKAFYIKKSELMNTQLFTAC